MQYSMLLEHCNKTFYANSVLYNVFSQLSYFYALTSPIFLIVKVQAEFRRNHK